MNIDGDLLLQIQVKDAVESRKAMLINLFDAKSVHGSILSTS